MTAVVAWLAANFQPIVVALLAIDAAVLPLFPKAGILVTIKNILSSL